MVSLIGSGVLWTFFAGGYWWGRQQGDVSRCANRRGARDTEHDT
jgi:hypothetical protein